PGDENTAGNFGRDAAGVLGHDSGGPRGDPAQCSPADSTGPRPTTGREPARPRPLRSPLHRERPDPREATPRARPATRGPSSSSSTSTRTALGGEATVENIQLRCRAITRTRASCSTDTG